MLPGGGGGGEFEVHKTDSSLLFQASQLCEMEPQTLDLDEHRPA